MVSNMGMSTLWPRPVRSRAYSAALITPKAYSPTERSAMVMGR
jgi:hypothetical protein